MNYPISPQTSKSISRKPDSSTEDLIVNAIAVVIQSARSRGQSLDEVKAEVLADDTILDSEQRHWLSEVVAQAWETLPE